MRNSILVILLSIQVLSAQNYLPPFKPWKGKSESILLKSTNRFITPFELSNGENSATSVELHDWFSELINEYPIVSRQSIGKTAQNRDIWMYAIRQAGKTNPHFYFKLEFMQEKLTEKMRACWYSENCSAKKIRKFSIMSISYSFPFSMWMDMNVLLNLTE
jgi:hypothetical protein